MPLSTTLASSSARGFGGLRTFAKPTAYESIASTTVGSGGSATVTLSSIPATYTHLQVRFIARGGRTDADTAAGGLYLQLNSSFPTTFHQVRGSGSAVVAQGYSGGTSNGFVMLWTPAANATASVFGAGIIDILDYADTNKTKVLRFLSGNDLNGSGYLGLGSTLLNSTSAITSITFGPTDGIGTIPQHSSFALYGIKGS